MKILVTGGAGFIGSAFIRYVLKEKQDAIINIDNLTYASNKDCLDEFKKHDRYSFFRVDIKDTKQILKILIDTKPDVLVHFAAETHVDQSITNPNAFIETNVLGTLSLLNASIDYLKQTKLQKFLFHHISTDEVFGDLSPDDEKFTESSNYFPSSPYSASKASSDHLVRAFSRTYGLDVIVTNCSNNYGPNQHREKLIPKTILNAIEGNIIPVYGSGKQIRDWLYVEDHVKALYLILSSNKKSTSYCIGGDNEIMNLDVVFKVCNILNNMIPEEKRACKDFKSLIEFVNDRPGHDYRYAINSNKLKNELGWHQEETFDSGLFKTVKWYCSNKIH